MCAFQNLCAGAETQPFTGDGLRHFAYQKEQKFYNGITLEDIHGDHATNVNGIHGTNPKDTDIKPSTADSR